MQLYDSCNNSMDFNNGELILVNIWTQQIFLQVELLLPAYFIYMYNIEQTIMLSKISQLE